MNITISILVFVLGLKGFFLLLDLTHLWIGLRQILTRFDSNVCGKYVFSGVSIKRLL